MKRAISIFLIFVMTAQCSFQLGLLAYFQANREYIASVLCINKSEPQSSCKGHCYLKRNLQLANDQEDAIPETSGKSKLEIPVFIISDGSFTTSFSAMACRANFPPVRTKLSQYHNAVFRPPSFDARQS